MPTQKATQQKTVRASVSFPLDLYQTLADLAKSQKVSVAWIVRDAAEHYVKNQWPLLAEDGRKSNAA